MELSSRLRAAEDPAPGAVRSGLSKIGLVKIGPVKIGPVKIGPGAADFQ